MNMVYWQSTHKVTKESDTVILAMIGSIQTQLLLVKFSIPVKAGSLQSIVGQL
jgi:hypothetical protein